MKKHIFLPFFASAFLFLLCGNESFSQDVSQFYMSGELRPRVEYRHGYGDMIYSDEDPAFFIAQRARVNLDFRTEKFKIFFSLQDVRVWGATSQLNSSDDFFSAHQLWGEYLFSDKFSMKLGRQELVYDNSRIFGNVGWAHQGRSHDLLLLKYTELDFVQVHLGLAYNQESQNKTGTNYAISGNYKAMQFLWARKEFDKLGVSVLLINSGTQRADTSNSYYIQTMGTYINYKISNYNLNLAGYYQTGKVGASGHDLSAFYLNAEISTPLDFGLAPALGVEYISGTDQDQLFDPASTDRNSFTPLFGTNHKFNGHMDYFYVGNHSGDVGLTDIYLSAKYKRGNMTPYAAFHYFLSAGNVLDPLDPTGETTLSNSLGMEIDLAIKLSLGEFVAFSAGYSHMFATESMQAVKSVGDHDTMNNWAWVMLSFKPDFFQKN